MSWRASCQKDRPTDSDSSRHAPRVRVGRSATQREHGTPPRCPTQVPWVQSRRRERARPENESSPSGHLRQDRMCATTHIAAVTGSLPSRRQARSACRQVGAVPSIMQSPRAIEALDSARMAMRARTASGPRHQSSDPQTSSRTGGRPITLCEVGREIVGFTASDLVEREGRLFSHLEEPVSIHSQ